MDRVLAETVDHHMIIVYVVCIDALNIKHKYKVSVLAILIFVIMYFAICYMNRTTITNPTEVWDDHDVTLPVLQFSIGLQSTMLNSLCIFLIFMGKQLVLMLLHPGHAVMQVYPKTQWIDDQHQQCAPGPTVVIGPKP